MNYFYHFSRELFSKCKSEFFRYCKMQNVISFFKFSPERLPNAETFSGRRRHFRGTFLSNDKVRNSHVISHRFKVLMSSLSKCFSGRVLKKCANPGLFFVYFQSFQTNIITILQQINVKKCPSSYTAPGLEPTNFRT